MTRDELVKFCNDLKDFGFHRFQIRRIADGRLLYSGYGDLYQVATNFIFQFAGHENWLEFLEWCVQKGKTEAWVYATISGRKTKIDLLPSNFGE